VNLYKTHQNRDPRRKIMRILNRDFYIGVGAGIVVTIFVLSLLVFYYMFSWWFGGRSIFSSKTPPDKGKMLESSSEVPSFPLTTLADYDWAVQSLDGHDFRMADVKGKVVFLNFWATWCSPCVAEMPSIQQLYDKLKGEGVVFVYVSNEETSKVSRFAKEKGFTFPIFTMHGAPPGVFKTRGIPATFILSPDGKIAFKHVGSAKWDDERSIDFMRGLR
jgi:thiol-disulfide isomerase/thioredoxin